MDLFLIVYVNSGAATHRIHTVDLRAPFRRWWCQRYKSSTGMHDVPLLGTENQTILQTIHCRLKPRSDGGMGLEIEK